MQDAPDTLTARFVTASGAPVAGTAVTWKVASAVEGTLTLLDATTRQDGTARAVLRAGSKAGDLDVTVASGRLEAQFHLRVKAASPNPPPAIMPTLNPVEAFSYTHLRPPTNRDE